MFSKKLLVNTQNRSVVIMTYMNSNSRFRPTKLIDRLCEDIFERTNQNEANVLKSKKEKEY